MSMPKYKMVIRTGLLGMLLVLGCAGTRPPAWGNPEDGIFLSYRNKPGSMLQYRSVMESANASEREGNSFTNGSDRHFRFHLNAQNMDSLLTFVVTVDSLAMTLTTGDDLKTMDFGEIEGKRALLKITTGGLFRSITAIDSIPQGRIPGMTMQSFSRNNPAAQLNPNFYPLPARALKAGDTWTEARNDTTVSSDTTRGFRTETISHRDYEYTVAAIEKKQGMDCVHLRIKADVRTDVNGNYGEMLVTMEREGEEKHDLWFAYAEGILVEYHTETFFEGTQAYSGQMNGTMPISSETKASLTLLQRLSEK